MRGFTLIEMSIVLVIIGLLVGGVLVGRDMIAAAELRAQITQIEKFQQAVNAFKVKYNALPGDIEAGTAVQFGFLPGWYRDGDGLLVCPPYNGETGGEPLLFWEDLTSANGMNLNLIEGNFTAAGNATWRVPTNVNYDVYFPVAKINNYGSHSHIVVWSIGGANYFAIIHITTFSDRPQGNAPLSVKQAYAIDSKMDDGLPLSGIVTTQAMGYNNLNQWNWWVAGDFSTVSPGTSALAANSTQYQCYDNGGVSGVNQTYSINGNNADVLLPYQAGCWLSFRFQ